MYTAIKTFVRFAKKKRKAKLFSEKTNRNKNIQTFVSMYQILDYREAYIHHQVIQSDSNVSIEHAKQWMSPLIMFEIDEQHSVE